ncbi:unnamed protein product [Adineta steineri]|uniref:PCI domain-containing protein n=1 Tax=Adineta steineri TaxID=433720 RepID=A0A813UQH4_9BILA|nr:unnamed protein product [Adineta steineri]CAF0826922.1 unnamed protein product [Adineta steineri]
MKKQQTFCESEICESYLAKAQYSYTIGDRLDQDLIERNLDKVIRGSEILEILHGLPLIKDYLYSLYKYRYADFLRLLHAELLQSYSSLTLKGMAQAFGSSEIFLDKELSRFIARGN